MPMLQFMKKKISNIFNKQVQEIGNNSTALQCGDNAQIIINEKTNKECNFQLELAVASLIGSWDENNKGDISIIESLADENYTSWIKKIRDIEGGKTNHLNHNSGIWSFKNRLETWNDVACRLFNDHLIRFKNISISTLSTIDPKFELEPEIRYAAAIYGKVLPHSSSIRKGISEGLAIISTQNIGLINCSNKFGDFIARDVIKEVFSSSDWKLWASTQDVQPILAEAAPDEFLDSLENNVAHHDKPFSTLFSQEGIGGFTGTNYMTGLLWSLESLAWSPDYLTRCVVLLGEMDSYDPGGNWTNRPGNSIVDILLPWLPHTTASFKRRFTSLKALDREFPDTAWKVSLLLLPKNHSSTSGTNIPKWRRFIPDDFKKEVTNDEYHKQVIEYGNYVVHLSKKNNSRLIKLIESLAQFHEEAFNDSVKVLIEYSISDAQPEEKHKVWSSLLTFTNKHKKYSEADWSLPVNKLNQLLPIIENLQPADNILLYQRLFTHNNTDLFEEKGNWREQEEAIQKRRVKALSEIFDGGGYEYVDQLVKAVESPDIVGNSLALFNEITDENLLLDYLSSEDIKTKQYISGYIWSINHLTKGEFIERINFNDWSEENASKLLLLLPFDTSTWDKVDRVLGQNLEYLYWGNANIKAYHSDDECLYKAADLLLKYNRPLSSIHCIFHILHSKKTVRIEPAVKALLGAVNTQEKQTDMDSYEIGEIIKFLQESSQVSDDERFRIEWAYLPLITQERDGQSSPEYLERRLSNDPSFFCEIIRLAYKSDKPDSRKEISESQKNIARNALELLKKWKVIPGTLEDNTFDAEQFKSWVNSTISISKESGHLYPALSAIGRVLINAPQEENGLYINLSLAEFLNQRDLGTVRDAYKYAIFNSRGVYWIDKEAKPEIKLSEDYHSKSEYIESLGLQRFAKILREISEHYSLEADEIIKRDLYKLEDTEI